VHRRAAGRGRARRRLRGVGGVASADGAASQPAGAQPAGRPLPPPRPAGGRGACRRRGPRPHASAPARKLVACMNQTPAFSTLPKPHKALHRSSIGAGRSVLIARPLIAGPRARPRRSHDPEEAQLHQHSSVRARKPETMLHASQRLAGGAAPASKAQVRTSGAWITDQGAAGPIGGLLPAVRSVTPGARTASAHIAARHAGLSSETPLRPNGRRLGAPAGVL
jgi:hypothetical protein